MAYAIAAAILVVGLLALGVPAHPAVEGRTDDVLVLPMPGGTVRVHPVVFHQVLDLLDTAGWQVRQHDSDLQVMVAGPAYGFDPQATAHAPT